uniref:Uncharacterized protein n=1 Tax=Myotis myotis TaxID=51298 RepID=A0A7J7ZX29_MYOMY|nr:hypothetical protein mMyoMyo1_009561 [Myotis myotis]
MSSLGAWPLPAASRRWLRRLNPDDMCQVAVPLREQGCCLLHGLRGDVWLDPGGLQVPTPVPLCRLPFLLQNRDAPSGRGRPAGDQGACCSLGTSRDRPTQRQQDPSTGSWSACTRGRGTGSTRALPPPLLPTRPHLSPMDRPQGGLSPQGSGCQEPGGGTRPLFRAGPWAGHLLGEDRARPRPQP